MSSLFSLKTILICQKGERVLCLINAYRVYTRVIKVDMRAYGQFLEEVEEEEPPISLNNRPCSVLNSRHYNHEPTTLPHSYPTPIYAKN